MRENANVDSDRETLLDERAAAKFLGICPRKLWGLANTGVVPFIRIGVKSKRYSRKDLEDFIAASRQRSPEPTGTQEDDAVQHVGPYNE